MGVPFTVSPQARDINFTFNDSCNCCCFGAVFKNKSKTQVYVNTKGQVYKFDKSKVNDQREALSDCVSNLTGIINNMAEDRKQHKASILRQVNDRIVTLDRENPVPITVDMVRKILQVIENTPSPKMGLIDRTESNSSRK